MLPPSPVPRAKITVRGVHGALLVTSSAVLDDPPVPPPRPPGKPGKPENCARGKAAAEEARRKRLSMPDAFMIMFLSVMERD